MSVAGARLITESRPSRPTALALFPSGPRWEVGCFLLDKSPKPEAPNTSVGCQTPKLPRKTLRRLLTALSWSKKDVTKRAERPQFWMNRALTLKTRLEANYKSMELERDSILEIVPELRRYAELHDKLFQGLTEEEEFEARSLELDIFKFNPSKAQAWRLFERLTKDLRLNRDVLKQCDDYLKALRVLVFMASEFTIVPEFKKHTHVKRQKARTNTTSDIRKHIVRKVADEYGHMKGRKLDYLTC